MGASLRAGLAALAAGPHDACVVALVDQPLLGAEAVARLRGRPGGPAAVATYGGAPRNPVLLAPRGVGRGRRAASATPGARAWLRAHPEQVHRCALRRHRRRPPTSTPPPTCAARPDARPQPWTAHR